METLTGDNNLEVTAAGGVPESVVGTLATLPYPIRISARIEDYAVVEGTQKTVPLIGLDVIAEADAFEESDAAENLQQTQAGDPLGQITDKNGIWVGSSLGRKPGDRVQLQINDQVQEFTVRGVYPDSNNDESAILMDIGTAQDALRRNGRVDRILLKVPAMPSLEDWEQRIRSPAHCRPASGGAAAGQAQTRIALCLRPFV